MTYTKVTKKEVVNNITVNSTGLLLGLANFDFPEIIDIYYFPVKSFNSELCTLLFGRDSVNGKLKMTKNVKKSLDRFYSKYRKGFVTYTELENYAQMNNVNFGIAFEMYLEQNGYTKTNSYVDNVEKIDVIKGNSKIQVKCAVIRDFSKKAYSMVNGTIR